MINNLELIQTDKIIKKRLNVGDRIRIGIKVNTKTFVGTDYVYCDIVNFKKGNVYVKIASKPLYTVIDKDETIEITKKNILKLVNVNKATCIFCNNIVGTLSPDRNNILITCTCLKTHSYYIISKDAIEYWNVLSNKEKSIFKSNFYKFKNTLPFISINLDSLRFMSENHSKRSVDFGKN